MTVTHHTADAARTRVPAALGRHRETVRAATGKLVDRLDPQTGRTVAYHLGWCDPDGNPTGLSGGKALRPSLAFLGAEAVGGDPEEVVPAAAAVELVHNFSLVHDDLMDRDRTRRHRPTVWTVWGDPAAVLAGDAMLSLAHEALLTSGLADAPRAGRVLTEATRELIAGQAADVAFEGRSDVTLSECLTMATGKTSALLGASAALGAVLAGATDHVVDRLVRFGRELGVAFQLIDDLLGMWGDPDQTGKPVHSDLRARKKTLPITWSIENGGSAGTELAHWMVTETSTEITSAEDAGVERAADLVIAAGGREWAESEAHRRIERGDAALLEAGLPAFYRDQFKEIGEYVLRRKS